MLTLWLSFYSKYLCCWDEHLLRNSKNWNIFSRNQFLSRCTRNQNNMALNNPLPRRCTIHLMGWERRSNVPQCVAGMSWVEVCLINHIRFSIVGGCVSWPCLCGTPCREVIFIPYSRIQLFSNFINHSRVLFIPHFLFFSQSHSSDFSSCPLSIFSRPPFNSSPQTLIIEQPSLPPHNSTPTTLRGWHSRAQRNVFDCRSMEVILEQFVWYRSQRIRIKTRISNSSVCSGGNDFLAFLPHDSSLYHPLVGLVLNHNINHFLVGSPSRGQC